MTLDHWGELAQQWRDSYKAFTKKLAADSSLPWKTVDEHNLESLLDILAEWKLEGFWLDEEIRALSLVWHQLEPWPDSSIGIQALNQLFRMGIILQGLSVLLSHLPAPAKVLLLC